MSAWLIQPPEATSSPVSPDIRWKYDVFLSFRGEDTRMSFTDHLYVALKQKGIITFRDDERLERGREISSELLRVIEESMFSIIIFSKNYASSTWCLDELAKIVDCIEEKRHTAFPVFYNIDPSEVRNQQTGDFKEAFDRHEQRNIDKVQRWRSALGQIANTAGWDSRRRHETQLIEEIVMEISKRLDQLFSSVVSDLVGINHRVKELVNNYLEVGYNDIRFIGICGMGGIGKTTIARSLYEMFSNQYDDRCFLANVREESKVGRLESLQQKLLSKVLKNESLNILNVYDGACLISRWLRRKKVFIVLDDVDQLEQLQALAEKREWFGYGSRIIITTRDKHLLISHGIYNIYEVRGLDHDEALTLFQSRAFKHKQPTNEHVLLSNHVIEYTDALPLALEVLGSLLCDRSVDEWRSALDKLQEVPNEKIVKVLRISYDGLDIMNQKIFLDIACFFKGKDKDRTMEKLESFGFKAAIGIRELIDKSLITISDNKLWMHGLIQEMGWEIVREQHRVEPGKWSRLWFFKDIYRVLKENTGTSEVEGILLDKTEKKITMLSGKSFSNMKNLRLLKITNNIINLSEDLEYLSNELRFLKWLGYPSSSLPSSFQPEKLFKLDMCYSHVKYLWNGIKFGDKLRTIKLCHSCNLIRTPNFSKVPNLERLDLEGCISLLEVHQSVGFLNQLAVLNLKDCKSLVSFPSNVCGLKSLKILNLLACSKLDKLPNGLGELECLEELDISATAIRQVPYSVVLLTKLKILSFRGCKGQPSQTWPLNLLQSALKGNSMLLQLPSLLGLSSLRKLDLSDCSLSEEALPSDLAFLSSLEVLNLSRNNLVSLPWTIKKLSNLKILCLENCQRLQFLSELPPEIIFVGAENCTSLELETLSTALEGSTSTHVELHFLNCSEPVDNRGCKDNLEVKLLKRWLERLNGHSSQFHIRLPGSQIPKWFGDTWEEGSSIEIILPINRLDEIMGFAVCVVFAVPCYQGEVPIVICGSLKVEEMYYTFRFSIPDFATIESDHLWLGFLSSKLFENPLPRRELMGTMVRASFEVLPRSNDKSIGYLKRCGIRLVYSHQDEANTAANHTAEKLARELALHPAAVSSMRSHRIICIPSVVIKSSGREVYDGAALPDDKQGLQNYQILSAP